jgi:anti-anti-sigma factor
MELKIRKENGVVVASVKGRINAVTAPAFENQVLESIGGDEKILILNLNELEYISSAGLRVILATAKKLKAKQGDIFLAELQGAAKEVFELSGFHSIFKIFDTEKEALNSI